MENWVHSFFQNTGPCAEAIALDTCIQLVKQGRIFICETTKDGWLFMVRV